MRHLFTAFAVLFLAGCSSKGHLSSCGAHGPRAEKTLEECEKLEGAERDYCREALSETVPPKRAAQAEVEEAPAAIEGSKNDEPASMP